MKKKLIVFLRKYKPTNNLVNFFKFFKELLNGERNFFESLNMYLLNEIINKIPIYFIRLGYIRIFTKTKIGKNSFIHMGSRLFGNITIGDNVVIGRNCVIIGEVTIENNVSITAESYIFSVTHKANSSTFEAYSKPVMIKEYSWIGVRSIIQPGVTINTGSIVGACSVVTRDTDCFSISAGIPARKINERSRDLIYNLDYHPLFQ